MHHISGAYESIRVGIWLPPVLMHPYTSLASPQLGFLTYTHLHLHLLCLWLPSWFCFLLKCCLQGCAPFYFFVLLQGCVQTLWLRAIWVKYGLLWMTCCVYMLCTGCAHIMYIRGGIWRARHRTVLSIHLSELSSWVKESAIVEGLIALTATPKLRSQQYTYLQPLPIDFLDASGTWFVLQRLGKRTEKPMALTSSPQQIGFWLSLSSFLI